MKVYDGDTIWVAARAGSNNGIYRFSVRIQGVDTPEMRPKKEGADEQKLAEEKECELGINRTGGGNVNSPQNTSVVPAQPSPDEKEDSQDEKDPAFWTFIKGKVDGIDDECNIDEGKFCYDGDE